MGVSHAGIILRHLVPNALGPIIVYATLTVPAVMLQEAFLSFLGLGVRRRRRPGGCSWRTARRTWPSCRTCWLFPAVLLS